MHKNIFLVVVCIFLAHDKAQAMELDNKQQYESELRKLLEAHDQLDPFINIDPTCDNRTKNYTDFFNDVCRSLENAEATGLINVIGIKCSGKISANLLKDQLATIAKKIDFPILILPDREPNKGKQCDITFYDPRLNEWYKKKITYGGKPNKILFIGRKLKW